MAGKEVTLKITLTEDYQIHLSGPLKNTILCVYLIEKAKMAVFAMELDAEDKVQKDSLIDQVETGLIVPGMKS